MPAFSYTPREAAVVSGAPLAAIQKAITARTVPAKTVGPFRRRVIDETALLAFALVEAMPKTLRLSPGAAYDLLRGGPVGADDLLVGKVVRIDKGKALEAARRRLRLYDHARSIIVTDPAIQGGAPTIRGTRITARSILGRLEDGDSLEDILDDYPHLDRDSVEAAALHAKANPPRGRPNGDPTGSWRRAS